MLRARATSRSGRRSAPYARLTLSAAALLAAGLASTGAHAAGPATISGPVGDPILNKTGTGLCSASAVSTNLASDFPGLQSTATYNGSVNTFLEAHPNDRVEAVIRTLLDLSNNNDTPQKKSYGDFIDAMLPQCKTGGCNFFINDATTRFGSRIRGFINVTADLVNQPIHFAFYADDAVGMYLFDKLAKSYEIFSRPPELGLPTWRTSNLVTFTEAGLYPLEINYVEIGDDAALEMSYFIGSYTDFELSYGQIGSPNLKTDGFTLFPAEMFFHTLSGDPSFPDLNKCAQCNRQFVNQPGNGGCQSSYYCNEAALCAPCDSGARCGPTCSPCGGATPFCVNINGTDTCGECKNDFDCQEGFSCDPIKHVCNECDEDNQCPRGEICENHSCVPCATTTQCAGNSCNCCPLGSRGKQMDCAQLDDDGPPVCVECLTTADCDTGLICDELFGRCVDKLPANEKPECCGEACVLCPSDVPFCLPGPVGTACAECRNDMDCSPPFTKEAEFCLSGYCTACTRDRRCGPRCETCGGDTPYCLGQTSENAKCVRCTSDSQCNGGTCDPMTNDCVPGCPMSCDPKTPRCDGSVCVECYADTQCPCNGTCDLTKHVCQNDCKTNIDCLGDEHCRWADNEIDRECAPGSMPDDVTCGGTLATACEGSIGKARRTDGNAPSAGIIGLALLALLGRRRIRGTP